MKQRGHFLMHVEVDGLPPDAFSVFRWQCSEGLSQLAHIRVDAFGPPDLDTHSLMQKNARVKLFMKGFHGDLLQVKPTEIPAMVTHVVVDAGVHASGLFEYGLTLQSRFYLSTLTQGSRVFLDKSVREIIKEVLEGDGFLEGDDFEFKLKKTYEPYEYTVQYQESNFDFLSRLMEDEGIYYYISDRYLGASQDAEIRDHLIILDDREFHPERSEEEWAGPVPFRPANPNNPAGEAIGRFAMEHAVLPREVRLKDYNYRLPTVEMKGEAPAVQDGFGTFFSYGEHFKTPEEGTDLAAIRAQEIVCRVKQWFGQSAVLDLEPALVFTLEDHPVPAWNRRYMIAAITHRGEQPGAGVSTQGMEGSRASYENNFTVIPADTQWRPARITPKPRINGITHATVDGESSSQYAEIDEMGRYKVRLPWDLATAGAGKASRFIRMAQPYSGPEYGMHFPLHKGAEVMLVHVDGDPDRPIIAGTVPNPTMGSPVTGNNHTQARIRTGSDNEILIEDTSGSEYVLVRTPAENSYMSMGADHHSEHAPPGVAIGSNAGITVNAGGGIQITAGAAGHDNGVDKQSEAAEHVHSTQAAIVAGLAAAAGVGMDLMAAGLVSSIPSLAGDVAGFLGGLKLPGVYVSAPGKVAVTAMSEVVVGALGSADVVALGPANILSVAGALVGGVKCAALVSLGKVEVISIAGDVLVEAKKRGNVKIEAKRGVHIKAETKQIVLEAEEDNISLDAKEKSVSIMAKENIHIATGEGKAEILIEDQIEIDSLKAKKIVLTAGKSTITMTDDKIQLKADTIEIVTNDGRCQMLVGKEGSDKGFVYYLDSKAGAKVDTKGDIVIASKSCLGWTSSGPIKINCKDFNAKGATKCTWPQHDDSA